MITNKHKLPPVFMRAVQKQEHRGGFLSASQTTKSIRQFWLEKRHHFFDEIKPNVEGKTAEKADADVHDLLYMLEGTLFHLLVGKYGNQDEYLEKYFETEIAGKVFSGASDRYNKKTKIITDWKYTSVWKLVFLKDALREWEPQLNCYCYLYRINNEIVKKLEVCVWARDWVKTKAKIDRSYPQVRVKRIPVPMWTEEEQHNYIENKIKELCKYENVPDNELPECTIEERWADPEKWKVYKKGNKKAMNGGTFEDRGLAQAFAEDKSAAGINVVIDHFPAISKKCADYCAYNSFCNQWEKECKNA